MIRIVRQKKEAHQRSSLVYRIEFDFGRIALLGQRRPKTSALPKFGQGRLLPRKRAYRIQCDARANARMCPKHLVLTGPNKYAEVTCLCGRVQLELDKFFGRPGCTSLLLSE